MTPNSKKPRIVTATTSGGAAAAVNCDGGRWKELNHELLAQILVCLPADERVRQASMVCRAWLACITGPYCWNVIDIEQWCRRTLRDTDRIDFVARRLVRRSRGCFAKFCAYRLGIAGFSFVVNSARCLKFLKIPMSSINNKTVEELAKSLANLIELDISYCLNITCKGLEAIGKNCKSLTHFKRNMPPQECSNIFNADNSEAMVIADTMPRLRHLELNFGRFADDGLDAIVTKCKALAYLDIQGCLSVRLHGDLEGKCMEIAAFRDPWDGFESSDLEPSEFDNSDLDLQEDSSASSVS